MSLTPRSSSITRPKQLQLKHCSALFQLHYHNFSCIITHQNFHKTDLIKFFFRHKMLSPDTQYRTPNIAHPASHTQQRTPNITHPTSDTQQRTPVKPSSLSIICLNPADSRQSDWRLSIPPTSKARGSPVAMDCHSVPRVSSCMEITIPAKWAADFARDICWRFGFYISSIAPVEATRAQLVRLFSVR